MGRQINRLSARGVATATAPGYYCDGGGLYLQVSDAGNKSWVFRYTINKRSREMGLGSLLYVPLSAAREKVLPLRLAVVDKIDPISQRKTDSDIPTFEKAATDYIAGNKAGWKNSKHADQWTNTLTTYAFPEIGSMLVSEIETHNIVKLLSAIWTTKTETATRVRGRIEKIIDYAKIHKWRTTENPARWRGHLNMILPKASKVRKVVHHPAMPYAEVPAFIAKLRKRKGIAAKCLEFTILSCVRTNESTGFVDAELDIAAALWTIPAERMKMEKEHRVPLTARQLEIIGSIPKICDHIFPNPKKEGLSENAMLGALKRAGAGKYTVHGFRSAFKDWASEETDYPNEVSEMAIAHAIGDDTEAAYRRGELLKKRRNLAEDWAAYCASAITSVE